MTGFMKLFIQAGKATPNPPVGPALGQKGIKAVEFCKTFNEQTKAYITGIQLRCLVKFLQDRKYEIIIRPPTTTYLLKRATGIHKADTTGFVAFVSAKILYEIALVKSRDPLLKWIEIRNIYRMILASATACGFIFY